MTFSAACDWSLLRSLLLVLAAGPICIWLEGRMRFSRRPMQFLWLLAAPFLFPELLLGYLFAPWTAGFPERAEVVCVFVLFLRSLPIGVVALWHTPPSDLSPAALFLRRLKLQSFRDVWELARCYAQGPIRRALPAVGLMFLVTFQEFEAAALLGATSWTDWLFTEYATGLSLQDSLRFLIRPVVMQLVILVLMGWSFHRKIGHDLELHQEQQRPVSESSIRLAEWVCLLVFALGAVVPLLMLSRELTAGWNWLWTQPTAGRTLAREIATSGLVALVAGLAAFCIGLLVLGGQGRSDHTALSSSCPLAPLGGRGLGRGGQSTMDDVLSIECTSSDSTSLEPASIGNAVKHSPPLPSPLPRGGGEGTKTGWGVLILLLLASPGLCGGLTVSLAMLSLSSRMSPSFLGMTPLAWVLALMVWLLPRAWLLQMWLARQSDPAAMHLIELLRNSPDARQRAAGHRWWWRGSIEPQIAAVGVLCYWAYLDLTTSALLSPPGMVSVMVRLYNFMHFGHSAAMSMEAAVVMFLPVILWGLMMAAARSVRWGHR